MADSQETIDTDQAAGRGRRRPPRTPSPSPPRKACGLDGEVTPEYDARKALQQALKHAHERQTLTGAFDDLPDLSPPAKQTTGNSQFGDEDMDELPYIQEEVTQASSMLWMLISQTSLILKQYRYDSSFRHISESLQNVYAAMEYQQDLMRESKEPRISGKIMQSSSYLGRYIRESQDIAKQSSQETGVEKMLASLKDIDDAQQRQEASMEEWRKWFPSSKKVTSED